MQFKALALSFFAGVVAAQDTNSTSLPDIVSNLPTCAIPCFTQGAKAAGCSTTDFQCLCGDGKSAFIGSAATCVLSDCHGDDTNTAISLAGQICTVILENPAPSDVASASNIVTSALGAASATSTPDAAARPELGYGIMGAAAAVAMMAL
ncbi:hypothetical protein HD806DRAFT_512971 [Xylariaceae sp. AK1471]|nr:hypothetical protein HD806DRAFT_512971 [Xylariaceae sp. AK1471]